MQMMLFLFLLRSVLLTEWQYQIHSRVTLTRSVAGAIGGVWVLMLVRLRLWLYLDLELCYLVFWNLHWMMSHLRRHLSSIFLELHLTQSWLFERHVRSVASSASQRIGILRRARIIFDSAEVMQHCFRSFMLPILEYASVVWCSAAVSHLAMLDRIV